MASASVLVACFSRYPSTYVAVVAAALVPLLLPPTCAVRKLSVGVAAANIQEIQYSPLRLLPLHEHKLPTSEQETCTTQKKIHNQKFQTVYYFLN